MRKTELFFSALLIPFDYLMLALAGLFVYYLRFSALTALRPVIFEIPFRQYFISVLFIAFVWLCIFALAGLYNLREKRHFTQEFGKIFIGCSVGTMLIVLFIFFESYYFSSRFIILAGWLMAIIFVSFGRILIHIIQLAYYQKRKGLESILVFGQSPFAQELIYQFQINPNLGYKVLGNPATIEELESQWAPRAKQITEIIQADTDLSREDAQKLIEFCSENQIIFKYLADTFNTLQSNVKIETLAGYPIIALQKTALDGWGRVIKRLFDIIFSVLLLVVLSPIFLIIILLIKLDSEGPAFVRLTRVGERGKLIKIYKFRSMIKNAESLKKDLLSYNERSGPLFKMVNDPRVTKFGKFLRRTSLDELPQLANVLKGEMSLVGPRPHEPEEVKQYQKQYKQLLTIKPGMTGLAQISGRSSLPFTEEAKLDIFYIENWSLGRDLQIFLKTIPVILSKKHVA